MKRAIFALSVLAALPVAPLAFADQDVLGIPDFTCQTPAEWRIHDYGSPAAFDIVYGVSDNNREDCPGVNTYGLFLRGGPECMVLNLADPNGPIWNQICQTDRPMDYDGDFEYALGGALLAAETGDGFSGGALACYGLFGHHPQGGVVVVEDLVRTPLGLPIYMAVTSDASLLGPLPGQIDCGDGTVQPCDSQTPEPTTWPQPVGGVVDTINYLLVDILNTPGMTCNPDDHILLCRDSCYVPFRPGADGSYYVYVGRPGAPATQGHIRL